MITERASGHSARGSPRRSAVSAMPRHVAVAARRARNVGEARRRDAGRVGVAMPTASIADAVEALRGAASRPTKAGRRGCARSVVVRSPGRRSAAAGGSAADPVGEQRPERRPRLDPRVPVASPSRPPPMALRRDSRASRAAPRRRDRRRSCRVPASQFRRASQVADIAQMIADVGAGARIAAASGGPPPSAARLRA